MTLVIALTCSDGVVMASDSQVTETHADIRYPRPKIFELTKHAVWAGSGDSQTILDVDEALTLARSTIENATNLSQALVDAIRPILDQRYKNVIQVPGEPSAIPWTDSLACGCDPESGKGWIIEVDRICNPTSYTRDGFHAIGIAAGLAALGNALLAHFRLAEKPLYYGKLLAYRVIDAAIQTSGYGVGEPIQMACVGRDGIQRITAEELAELRSAVGGWKEEERAALDRIAGAPLLNPTPLPPPTAVG